MPIQLNRNQFPDKSLAELFRQGVDLLKDFENPALEAKVLLLKSAAVTEKEFFVSGHQRLASNYCQGRFLKLIQKRLDRVPLAYLTGFKEFWSLPFEVSPAVLIPRPETEILVEKVLELSTRREELILDVGTGSGNIAIALAKELPRARIVAVDKSLRALKVARNNAARHKVKNMVIESSNLFSASCVKNNKFDFIVSNPPYVSFSDWIKLPSEIRDYEPKTALLAGESGLEFISLLIRKAAFRLKPGGYLIFEIGDRQRDQVFSLFEQNKKRWTEIETALDWSGRPRVITARLN